MFALHKSLSLLYKKSLLTVLFCSGCDLYPITGKDLLWFRFLYGKCLQVGIIAGNIVLTQEELFANIQQTLDNIKDFGMICHMFALGLEMDPCILFQRPTREAMVAYSGMLSTFILACLLTPFFHYSEVPNYKFTFSLSVTLTGTASPC